MTPSAASRHTPFGRGSVSLGLHTDSSLGADRQIDVLLDQAAAAERAGFDGVTVSEHHNGFPGYLPQPLLASTWILDVTSRVWSGPAPMVLSLRNARLVAEELAWTAARHPRRFGAAFAPGYARTDFEHLDVPFDDRAQRFEREITTLASMLGIGGSAETSDDAAVKAWPNSGATLLATANSVTGVRRAAVLGVGIMFPGGEDPVRLGRLAARYRELGGLGPIVWTRSVWLGEPPTEAVAQLSRRYRAAATAGMRQRSGFRVGLLCGHVEQVLASLIDDQRNISADAVNLRVHLPGVPPERISDVIGRIGHDILPGLHAENADITGNSTNRGS